MARLQERLTDRLTAHAPFDLLPRPVTFEARLQRVILPADSLLCAAGAPLDGLYVIESGAIDIEAEGGDIVSHRRPGDVIGERGLMADGRATLTARTAAPTALILLPTDLFQDLLAKHPAFAAWFLPKAQVDISADTEESAGLTALSVGDLMAATPVTCPPGTAIQVVAEQMRDHRISSVMVVEDGALAGIVTARDLTNRVLAEGLDGRARVRDVMTADPVTIAPSALGLDALVMLADHSISHLPVVEDGRIHGMIGRTDLFRRQAATASHMIAEIVAAPDAVAMAAIVARAPALLAELVAAGTAPAAVCRRITDITDAVTRRLLILAEAALGPAPVPWLWLACGSQGRREQTGVSDQDNCLILDDSAGAEDDAYFAELARIVSSGLDTCGFVYCPGDMMATNPRWRQKRRVWRGYFDGWIDQPDGAAQMLASVMFDLRPIGGTEALFDNLQAETLARARGNSIFVAHMAANALKHTPPLSLFRGFALIRSGEHKNTVDLKHSGVVPVVDLGRIYALQGAIPAVNTRARLRAAKERRVVSEAGATELLDAYDLIAETRLRHQAAAIRRGKTPDNYLSPQDMSELERNHLRGAFMVVKALQSALGHGRAGLG